MVHSEFLDAEQTAAAVALWNELYCAEDRLDLERIGLRAHVMDGRTAVLEIAPLVAEQPTALISIRVVDGTWSPLPAVDAETVFEELIDALGELDLLADALRRGRHVPRHEILTAINDADRRNAALADMVAASTTVSGTALFQPIPPDADVIAALIVERAASCPQ